jgi:THO complex subunit 5
MGGSLTVEYDTPEAVTDAFERLITDSSIEVELLEAYAATLMSRIRHFNREAAGVVTSERQRTMDARNVMDQTHLVLQNALYERRHLEREIEKCRQFE